MKKMFFALVALIMSLGAVPVMADGVGASAGAVAGASAGATASGGTTKNYGLVNGGIGAALCADSIGTPIFSVSTSRRACEIMQGAMAMHDRGLLTAAEARAYGIKALEMSNAILITKSTKLATPQNINGDWASLTRTQQKAIVECKALWNGKKVQGCTY